MLNRNPNPNPNQARCCPPPCTASRRRPWERPLSSRHYTLTVLRPSGPSSCPYFFSAPCWQSYSTPRNGAPGASSGSQLEPWAVGRLLAPTVAWAPSAVDQPGQQKSVACAKGSEGGTGTSTDECGARQAGERAEEAAPRLTLTLTPAPTLTLSPPLTLAR